MAEGLRIRHTELRPPVGHKEMVIAVRDRTQRVGGPNPPLCSRCSVMNAEGTEWAVEVTHEGYKTRHVTIDTDGYALVSEGVWKGLCRLADCGGFELVNTITNPPRITMALGSKRGPSITVHHRIPREIRSK